MAPLQHQFIHYTCVGDDNQRIDVHTHLEHFPEHMNNTPSK